MFYFVRNPNQLANETFAAQHRLSSPLLLGNPASPQDKDARRIYTGDSDDDGDDDDDFDEEDDDAASTQVNTFTS